MMNVKNFTLFSLLYGMQHDAPESLFKLKNQSLFLSNLINLNKLMAVFYGKFAEIYEICNVELLICE